MLLADALITKTSEPDETPVICQLTVAIPGARLPTLTVGALTEKRPF